MSSALAQRWARSGMATRDPRANSHAFGTFVIPFQHLFRRDSKDKDCIQYIFIYCTVHAYIGGSTCAFDSVVFTRFKCHPHMPQTARPVHSCHALGGMCSPRGLQIESCHAGTTCK